jgi:hypothetical protein
MSNTRRLICQLLLVNVIGAFLFGCFNQSLSASQMEKSLFVGVPCSAPCWQVLSIGKSNESDVRATLLKLAFIDQDTINFHEMSMPSINPGVYAPGVEITAACVPQNVNA